ncbi:hypothetical protein NLI96_g7176 [Meripilus lineatus]|uniref:Beta-galactosidase n=1 Tax=Meripilus lineatus TaxID=2056292 RepID=A0AAD5V015_9APHY|nr:hypothetical protein NLI96_g7176 [Physisporinus lineatus]
MLLKNLCLLFVLFLRAACDQGHLFRRNSTGLTDAVTWDRNSLFVQGQRIFVLSAEFHPWRLPNPDLWLDVFQKIRANGFNTVSFIVSWTLHYPTPGTNGTQGDFEPGTFRDIQRFIDGAKEAGLWLIARPGPYINAETTGGGFPGWVGNIAGSLRTDNPNYTQAWMPYMRRVSQLIAQNQVSNGGPIILVQAENEFSAGTGRSDYMQNIIDTFRANGVTIPITHNDQHAGAAGNFSPDLPGTGRVNIYCGDTYPQGASRWSQVQTVYYSNHQAVAPNNPLCLAEFGGGFLLGWASGNRTGTGYEKYSGDLTDASYENVFYKDAYAQRATIFMLFGGTNWGQTGEPTVYSSYDYGGGINENRVAGPKMNEMRLQGLFLRVSRDILASNLIANGTNYTSSPLIHTAELRNLQSNAAFYILRHNDATSTALTEFTLNISTSLGHIPVPSAGLLTLNGRESKIIVTDYAFGESASKVLYSTAEILTWSTMDDIEYIVFYALKGQTGETVFDLNDPPISISSSTVNVNHTVSGSTVTLNYILDGASFVTISCGPKSVVAVILEKQVALQWHATDLTGDGTYGNYFSVGTNRSVLVGGPYLVRTAAISADTLHLAGDLNGTTTIEVVAPSPVSELTWNGIPQQVVKTPWNTLTTTIHVPSNAVNLPSLDNWKVLDSLPEVEPEFDDSDFVTADQTATNYTNLPPLSGDKVLYSQQYGFYGGNLIFRGHFNASGEETAFLLTVQGGFVFGYSAFLNGVFLGSNQGSPTVSLTSDSWTVPNGTLRIGQDNVLTVIQANGGKEPRGIRGYAITGGNTTFSHWKLQGNQGGAANAPDKFRGYLNEGGLYAERIGAHLPGYPDSKWKVGSPVGPSGGVKGAGINFYRTTFRLDLPKGTDIPIRLSITPSDISSNFRVQIYLNGWQLGKYINNFGPQTIFVFPAGQVSPLASHRFWTLIFPFRILKSRGENTLALSLWSLDASGASIAGIQLIMDGNFATGLDIQDYGSTMDFNPQSHLRPVAIDRLLRK